VTGGGANHDRRGSDRHRPESVPEDDLPEPEPTARGRLELREGGQRERSVSLILERGDSAPGGDVGADSSREDDDPPELVARELEHRRGDREAVSREPDAHGRPSLLRTGGGRRTHPPGAPESRPSRHTVRSGQTGSASGPARASGSATRGRGRENRPESRPVRPARPARALLPPGELSRRGGPSPARPCETQPRRPLRVAACST